MLYPFYQAAMDFSAPWRQAAQIAAAAITRGHPAAQIALRRAAAAFEVAAHAHPTHRRPAFGIDRVPIGNREVLVREEAVLTTPFATLRRFAKDDHSAEQPRLLVVAPMSGHFATLLRQTVRTVLPDHDVYVTDWHNARDIPLRHGPFTLDDFVEHLIWFLEAIGPGAHVLGICQPTVAALAAASLLAQDNNPAQPASITLLAGPVDTRRNPSRVNALATSRPLDWFERTMISTVPSGFLGAGRKVYPGFLQLAAFMSMNLDRHARAYQAHYQDLLAGDAVRAASHRAFYDEYLAVMDLPAEFFLDTIRTVFQEHHLPRGLLRWRGQAIEPRAIRRSALLTVEGELDDICSLGQTMAALDLCVGLRPMWRRHHLQTGVGHYGVFSGRRWSGEIYPRIRAWIQSHRR